MNKGYKVGLLVLLVLLIDQASKYYIKTHFEYNEEVAMFGLDWAKLHFVENEGMAFGIKFEWQYGKLALSLFRILMVAGLVWYIRLLLRARVPMGFVYSVGLIMAGAVGNIIDSAFYGLIFTESPYHGGLAQLVPMGQGYAEFLHGKVVDMLYFPMTWIHLPEWVPLLGGDDYLFFSPIFNVADASITVGVFIILLFQRRFFQETPQSATTDPNAVVASTLLAEGDGLEIQDAEGAELAVDATHPEEITPEVVLADNIFTDTPPTEDVADGAAPPDAVSPDAGQP